MTYAKRKEQQRIYIANQRKAIGELYQLCGGGKLKENRLSNMLLAIEKRASKSAEDYCNGVTSTEQWEEISNSYYKEVQKLFNNALKGLEINGDARGYALKINDQIMRADYNNINLHKDWGFYGILGPTFEV